MHAVGLEPTARLYACGRSKVRNGGTFFLICFPFFGTGTCQERKDGKERRLDEAGRRKGRKNYEPCVRRCEGLRPSLPHFLSLATLQELPQDPQYLSLQELVCEPFVCKWRGPSVFLAVQPCRNRRKTAFTFLRAA